ncbi:helix-turn-helix domain-containing protein [Pedobacter caeni]|uniref:Helix-turn-helix domain-containing protein n=1 Tax=Pedobacter caeni TaxID=288992 RepID=A0A1M4TA75_9SPHI|nr:helix-turn-helix transcriptional regulator [Pedobacter caeni]SHE41406.1 Helix-turn-helix domain-containing protein [Pedobacter caeni]
MKTKTDGLGQAHQGRNVKRFREMLGIRQEALAEQLGPDWSQKRISLIEAREVVDPNLLNSIAELLKIPVQVLENFDEQAAINYFNTFNQGSQQNVHNGDGDNNINTPNFDPVIALVEAMKELKTIYGGYRELQSKNETLYESLLHIERERIADLQSRLA